MILPVSHPQRGKFASPVLLTSLLISQARQQATGTQREWFRAFQSWGEDSYRTVQRDKTTKPSMC